MLFRKLFRGLLYMILVVAVPLALLYVYWGGSSTNQILPTVIRTDDSVLYFSHRGNFLYYPENSVEGIHGASEKGFHAIEIDIASSGDGELIAFHDDNGTRLLGIDDKVEDLSTDELQKYPILVNETEISSSHVPALEEILENMDGMFYYLDMKVSSFAVADQLAKLIKKYKAEKSVIVASSDILFLFYLEELHPEIITAHEGFDAGKEWTWWLMPSELRPDYLSGYARETDEDHLKWLKDNDLLDRRIVYGVDTANLDVVLKSGYKNIILDYDSVMDRTLDLR